MISNSYVEKHNTFQWFQAQMLKNTMFFNDVKCKCWKTQCFSMMSSSNVEKHNVFFFMISSSNIEKHNAFQWVQAQMLKKTMLFNDFKLKCWKTQRFFMFFHPNPPTRVATHPPDISTYRDSRNWPLKAPQIKYAFGNLGRTCSRCFLELLWGRFLEFQRAKP